MVKMAQYGTKHGHAAGKLRSMQTNAEVEVVGVFEPDERRREEVAQSGGYEGVYWFESEAEMLGDDEIVAVASEGANVESLDQTEAIIQAGKHVWYDKPAGENWDQWQRIIARAREGDLLIQMGYMFRYHDGYCKIAEWVHSGFLGDVFAVRAHMSTFLGKAQKKVVAVHQGGVFFDLCGHQLDQIVHLLGRPERVTPFLREDMFEVEGFTDNGVGIFEFERAIAIVDIAALEPRPNARRFEVYGTKGSAIMEPMEPAEKIRLCLDEARDGFEEGVQFVDVAQQSRQDLYDLELEAFLPAIRGTRAPDRSYEHELLVQEAVLRGVGRL
ncbi:MAG: Gfo/Idh/MocA family oxidoreductase [Gemmatimonadetes bacterium]|nr:Gfo/Idh/MocA family oxidoreductase [Gemmatimonadota bacterium]MYF74890.1 Gfo/Idh/MocA family oxidoreductase [Gemmatimonadota bacterium]MYK53443.1 Gfo/Idh/MocA family oxidoreductase [Gemmatimonadota bacterium]